MKSTIKLGSVSGIPLGLHWSVAVFGLFAAWNLAVNFLPTASPGGALTWYVVAAVVGVAGLGASILAHELGHALVALREGVEVRSINLWLFGGVAQLGSDPPTAGASFRISAAGPARSFVLAVLAGIPALTAGFLGSGVGGYSLGATLLGYLALINLALGVFNLLPAFPLDGGRILQAALWARHGDRDRATVSAAGIGRGLGALMFLGGLYLTLTGGNGIWTMLIALFIRGAAGREAKVARRRIRRRQLAANPPLIFQTFFAPPPATAPATGGPDRRRSDVIDSSAYEVQ